MLSRASPGYRGDIDGLRAIAVLSVVAFHAFPQISVLGGGFVGVDVFFVISGYLISGIILGNLAKGTFSFSDFYARRVRRIFPALVLVFAACMALGWVLLMGDGYKLLGKHVAGGAAFVSNFVLWRESGYFAGGSETKVLLHLWSLGIEEQFYLLWPLTLFLAARRPRLAPVVMTTLLVASFALNIARVRVDPTGTFYSPLTRFWELFAGGLLAWANLQDPSRVRWILGTRGSHARSILGLGMIGAALLFVRKDDAFPGWWALLPVGGAALLISSGPRAWVNEKILSHPAMVFVGLISYPLYVWHWPLLVFEPYAEYGAVWWQLRIAAVVLAFLLAWLTARFVEFPIRSGQASAWKVAVPASCMLAAFALGLLTFERAGFPWRFSKSLAEYADYFGEGYWQAHDIAGAYHNECSFNDAEKGLVRSTLDPSCYTPHSAKSVVLWGDSHAAHLRYGLEKTLPADISILQLSTSACFPSVAPQDPNPHPFCAPANAFARARIQEVKPDLVVLAQVSRHERTDFAGIVDWLERVGVKHVVVLGPVPTWHPDLNQVIARHYWPDPPARINAYLDRRAFDSDRILRERMRGRPATFVSLIEHLCNDDGCLAYLDGDPKDGIMAWDYGHFTTKASLYVARTILAPAILTLLAKDPSSLADAPAGKNSSLSAAGSAAPP
jgi:peptidoglycan/LPS O-acetylase OafA/YrhL